MSEDLLDVGAVVGDHTGRSRQVLEYVLEMKRIIDRAKKPGFDDGGWEPLARFVDADDFVRVGPFKDRMGWPEYVAFLTGWATRRHWECSLRGVTEAGDRVFLELEERSEPGDSANAANSLSVYEFDDHQRLRRLAVYLQMAMPPPPGPPAS
jgi:hypothetical protein